MDAKLRDWIQRDLAENAALQEFCDVDQALPDESHPAELAIRPPKFRIVGKTKNYRKAHKQKQVPTILESKVLELEQMMVDRVSLREKIERLKAAVDKLKISNARAQRDNFETHQFLERVHSEIEIKKLEQLKQLEEMRLTEKRLRIEANRSQKAQAEISQKKTQGFEELENLAQEVCSLETKLSEFRSKRDRDKRALERNVMDLRQRNANLKVEIQSIERQLAEQS
jgi:chromosome segregation ATPase